MLSAKGYDLGTINSELQRMKDELKNIEQIKPVYDNNIADCEELPSLLHTLEVKDVDLEKEMGKYLDANDIEFSYQIKLLDFAKYFFGLGLKAKGE